LGEEIFKETTRNRPQIDRALARLGKDDVFVVAWMASPS
jgi:hypothetical protein